MVFTLISQQWAAPKTRSFDILLTYCSLSYNFICLLQCLELWWQSNRHRHVKGEWHKPTHKKRMANNTFGQHIWELCQKHANTWRAHCTCIACQILLGVLGETKDRKGPSTRWVCISMIILENMIERNNTNWWIMWLNYAKKCDR